MTHVEATDGDLKVYPRFYPFEARPVGLVVLLRLLCALDRGSMLVVKFQAKRAEIGWAHPTVLPLGTGKETWRHDSKRGEGKGIARPCI